MIVKSILIYPIKGMKGVAMDSCATLAEGFENDRRYMLVDRNNNFISQRSHSKLALITAEVVQEQIQITYNDSKFSFSIHEYSGDVIDVTLFDNVVSGTIVSENVSGLFSDMLDDDVRLVKMPNDNRRFKKLIKGPEKTKVSFADGYPYLIAGTASLNQLNEKLDNSVLMDRFRPNIVIETEVPHEEDNWESIQIGGAQMMVIKPCARCPVVTINQQTAIKTKDTLKALSTYRKKENKVYFGANAISLGNSQINVGDSVVTL